jgi:hypothetical protein
MGVEIVINIRKNSKSIGFISYEWAVRVWNPSSQVAAANAANTQSVYTTRKLRKC